MLFNSSFFRVKFLKPPHPNFGDLGPKCEDNISKRKGIHKISFWENTAPKLVCTFLKGMLLNTFAISDTVLAIWSKVTEIWMRG